MHPIALLIIAAGNLCLGAIAWISFKRFQAAALKHSMELMVQQKTLKRQVLELQVLRSLGERVGYSLDLRQILEVITDSLSGLVDFATVSYMILGTEGRILMKTRAQQPVSNKFIQQAKAQMLSAFEVMAGVDLQPSLIDETITGTPTDDTNPNPVNSFFNLPVIVGGKAVAVINVSSLQKGLYGDEETTILYTILNQVSVQASKLSQVIENEKRRLSAMIASLADGVVMVDPHFNMIVSNPALVRLIAAQSVDGQPIHIRNLYDVVALIGTKSDLEGSLKTALTTQQVVKLPPCEIGDKALEIEVEPVKDKFGYLLGAAVVFHDITEAKSLEKLRQDFTAMMVHELRTPLTTITYSTDMMQTDLLKLQTEEIGQNLSIIQTTASHMLSLVNELLDVAKIESGKFQIVKAPNDITALVKEEEMMFKPLVDKKGIRMVISIEPGMPVFNFDKKRIEQSLNNLISNAVKYTDKGSVTVKVAKAGSGVEISVNDTGDGLKEEDIKKLFSKFEQLGKGKTGERGGTGLGLVVTKGIIEAHGGTIAVTSPGPGQGSTFKFTLPLN